MPEPARDLTPLEQIPDRFASDPQAGLKEIGRHLGTGVTAQTYRVFETPAWETSIVIPGELGHGYRVRYEEPVERDLKQNDYDSAKTRAIRRWLEDLCNVVRQEKGEPPLDFGKPERAKSIAAALGTARSTPEPKPIVALATHENGTGGGFAAARKSGQEFEALGQREESFVERVLSRQRKRDS